MISSYKVTTAVLSVLVLLFEGYMIYKKWNDLRGSGNERIPSATEGGFRLPVSACGNKDPRDYGTHLRILITLCVCLFMFMFGEYIFACLF